MKHDARRIIRLIFGSFACCAIFSCDTSGNAADLSLEKPLTQRQIAAFESSTLRADIVINDGPVQSFTFQPQDDLNVSISGVISNETNTISITWLEILNGYPVELTDQAQSFVASGNVTITAPHLADQYDYDLDGANNLQERANGTCVWSAQDTCLLVGQIDVPQVIPDVVSTLAPDVISALAGLTPVEQNLDTSIPEPYYEFDYTNTTDLLVNGTFDENIDDWYAVNQTNERFDNGAYCVTLPIGEPVRQSVLTHLPFLTLKQGTRYAIEFDVRATRNAVINTALVSLTPHITYNDQHVLVGEQWNSYVVHYEHTAPTIDRATIGFGGVYSRAGETTYCFDNLRLLEQQ